VAVAEEAVVKMDILGVLAGTEAVKAMVES